MRIAFLSFIVFHVAVFANTENQHVALSVDADGMMTTMTAPTPEQGEHVAEQRRHVPVSNHHEECGSEGKECISPSYAAETQIDESNENHDDSLTSSNDETDRSEIAEENKNREGEYDEALKPPERREEEEGYTMEGSNPPVTNDEAQQLSEEEHQQQLSESDLVEEEMLLSSEHSDNDEEKEDRQAESMKEDSLPFSDHNPSSQLPDTLENEATLAQHDADEETNGIFKHEESDAHESEIVLSVEHEDENIIDSSQHPDNEATRESIEEDHIADERRLFSSEEMGNSDADSTSSMESVEGPSSNLHEGNGMEEGDFPSERAPENDLQSRSGDEQEKQSEQQHETELFQSIAQANADELAEPTKGHNEGDKVEGETASSSDHVGNRSSEHDGDIAFKQPDDASEEVLLPPPDYAGQHSSQAVGVDDENTPNEFKENGVENGDDVLQPSIEGGEERVLQQNEGEGSVGEGMLLLSNHVGGIYSDASVETDSTSDPEVERPESSSLANPVGNKSSQASREESQLVKSELNEAGDDHPIGESSSQHSELNEAGEDQPIGESSSRHSELNEAGEDQPIGESSSQHSVEEEAPRAQHERNDARESSSEHPLYEEHEAANRPSDHMTEERELSPSLNLGHESENAEKNVKVQPGKQHEAGGTAEMPKSKDIGDGLSQPLVEEQDHLSACETYLDAMENHVEQLLLDFNEKEALANATMQQQLKELQTQLELEQHISSQSNERLTTCEHTLASVERHFENVISEHEKNHSIADTTVVQLRHQFNELQRQLESKQQASAQAEERLGVCEKSMTATKDHYETLILELEKDHSVAVSTMAQLQKQEMELLQRLSDSERRAFTLVEERVSTCEKSLKAMEHHLEMVILDHNTNQSVAETTILRLQEQVALLERQNLQLETRATSQARESAATCEKSLSSQELHYETLISKYEENSSIAEANLAQLEQYVSELQNQISEKEQRSLGALEESQQVWEQEKQSLIAQAAQNSSMIESQWRHRYLNLRNAHMRSQQDLRQRQQEMDALLDQFYTTRQEMFAAKQALRALQSNHHRGIQYIKRIIGWIFGCWDWLLEHLHSWIAWIKTWTAAVMDRLAQAQESFRNELETTGTSALLQWLQDHVVVAAIRHIQTTTIIRAAAQQLLVFRVETLPGVALYLELRRQLQLRLSKVVRAVSHLVLAYCHVTKVGQQQAHSYTAFAVSCLEWSFQHNHKVVQRTELAVWAILICYLVVRTKALRLLLFLRKKKSVPRRASRRNSRTAAITPTKITPAFRNRKQPVAQRTVLPPH